jgi:hypothetical protein
VRRRALPIAGADDAFPNAGLRSSLTPKNIIKAESQILDVT